MAIRATGGKFGLNFVGICRRWTERKVKNEVNTTRNKQEKKDTFLVGFCAIFFSREGGGGTFFRKWTWFCKAVCSRNMVPNSDV